MNYDNAEPFQIGLFYDYQEQGTYIYYQATQEFHVCLSLDKLVDSSDILIHELISEGLGANSYYCPKDYFQKVPTELREGLKDSLCSKNVDSIRYAWEIIKNYNEI